MARALGDNPLVDVGLADWRLDVLAETGAEGLLIVAGRPSANCSGRSMTLSERSNWMLRASRSPREELRTAKKLFSPGRRSA